MTGYRGALDLSNELLHDILDLIAADPERLVSVDKRAYLSQESFRPDPLPSKDQVVNIGKFRLLCRRFAALGAPHQFARITTRFSSKGLARLEAIADQPHLAKHVKKFSYKVPYFCTQGNKEHGIIITSFLSGLANIGHLSRPRKYTNARHPDPPHHRQNQH